MKNFAYARADTTQAALNLISRSTNAKFLGGGTNLVDLMRENIEQPDTLIDVTSLPLNTIDELPDGGVSIGAAVKNTAVAYVIESSGSAIRFWLRRWCSARPVRFGTWQRSLET